MAEEKKSFVLYSDLIHTVRKMPPEKAGKLLLTMLEYVNDLNPVIDDMMIELVFEPIKQQMKRDLIKWEGIKGKRSEAGKASAEAKKLAKLNSTNSTSVESDKQTLANSTVSVNVNGNVINKNTNSIVDRKLKFSQTLTPFLDLYGKEVLNDFYVYWSEPNKSNTKFKQELEKTWDLKGRLARWAKSDFNNIKSTVIKGATDQSQNKNLFAI